MPATAYHNRTATSQEAAHKIESSAATMRRQVLAALVAAGHAGLTDDQMQRDIPMQGSSQRPRRGELVVAGFVENLGERRATLSGCSAIVWHATIKGKMAMAETP